MYTKILRTTLNNTFSILQVSINLQSSSKIQSYETQSIVSKILFRQIMKKVQL